MEATVSPTSAQAHDLQHVDLQGRGPLRDEVRDWRTGRGSWRTILTQDRGILKLKRVTHGYLVRSPHVPEQVAEVIGRFDLLACIDPFFRCTQCNGLIMSFDKTDVQADLPPKTREYYHEFFRCQTCGKVYWKGP